MIVGQSSVFAERPWTIFLDFMGQSWVAFDDRIEVFANFREAREWAVSA